MNTLQASLLQLYINTATVKVLSVDSNNLNAQEASPISIAMCCLEELYIHVNNLGDDGAVMACYHEGLPKLAN